MKTADLQRSKRLKELGWGQETHFFHEFTNTTFDGLKYVQLVNREYSKKSGAYFYEIAPTAGEMIEWLLVETKDGNICNALADACAWVLERKK